jgi:hypothetical protein
MAPKITLFFVPLESSDEAAEAESGWYSLYTTPVVSGAGVLVTVWVIALLEVCGRASVNDSATFWILTAAFGVTVACSVTAMVDVTVTWVVCWADGSVPDTNVTMLELAEAPPVGGAAAEAVEIKGINTGDVPLPDAVAGCRETAPVALDKSVINASEIFDWDAREALNAPDGQGNPDWRATDIVDSLMQMDLPNVAMVRSIQEYASDATVWCY